jgi:resolvase-like protein
MANPARWSRPTASGVKLSLGGQVYDPSDPMGKMFFNILATFAEFEVDLLCMRTREGMAVARARGKAARQTAETQPPTAGGAPPHARHRRPHHRGSRRAVLGVPPHRVPRPPALSSVDRLISHICLRCPPCGW